MIKLVLVRHGQSEWNLENRFTGWTDVELSEKGVEEAKEAEGLGASYLTAGHIYATDCKKGLPPRGLTFLEKICRNTTIPVYAIGGIGLTDGRIEEVIRCGARGACIMSEVMKI